MFCTCQIPFILKIFISHNQWQSCRRGTSPLLSTIEKSSLNLRGKLPSLFCKRRNISNILLYAFPTQDVYDLAVFRNSKMKQGIYPFRLTADTMNRLYKITPIMYYFIKETRFRKSILQIRIKNFISIRHQIRTTLLFSIFQCIKSIQQSTSHKTHFGNIRLVTSSCTQFHPE